MPVVEILNSARLRAQFLAGGNVIDELGMREVGDEVQPCEKRFSTLMLSA